jgi:PBP1b-binding outer membrane lipoprotein LpoB
MPQLPLSVKSLLLQKPKQEMTVKKALLTLGIIAALMFYGCSGNKELKENVQPIADAMCTFINIQNQLKIAVEANDSARIDSLSVMRHQVQIEMTVLNEEFNAKYGNKNNDEKFLKEYKKVMNDALLECPHLSKEDRDMMEKGMDK